MVEFPDGIFDFGSLWSGILSELKTMYTFLTLDQFVGFIIFRMNAGNLLKLQ